MTEVTAIEELNRYFPIYKFCSLYNMEGRAVVRYNQPGAENYERKQNQILTHLTSELTPAGLYILKLKNDSQPGSQIEEICYKKGEPEDLERLKQQLEAPKVDMQKENFLSYERALKLETQIIKLTAENENLRNQVKELTEELEDLETENEEAEKEKKTLSEAAGSSSTLAAVLAGLKELIPSVVGIFNTHFELKERQIKALQQNNQAAPQQQQRPAGYQLDETQIKFLTWFEGLKQQAPEEYNKILNTLNNPPEQ